MISARRIEVRGIVQGVGFRPYVFRLAHQHSLHGWVLNQENGVEIRLEGPEEAIAAFLSELAVNPPPASRISGIDIQSAITAGLTDFTIRESARAGPPSARVSPDLPVCDDCLRELFCSTDPRCFYPYINCTNCGPRFSVIERLPYDRPNTTMKHWALDAFCAAQYHDPVDRRFHAQPVACPHCGPHYRLESPEETVEGDEPSVRRAAELLAQGYILAVKGIGGYHLACNAREPGAVTALRGRKFRKDKPFAVMVSSLGIARTLLDLSPEAESLLTSAARPIVLAQAKVRLAGVAPCMHELGVMLPYAPLHHLLFAAGAPEVLVMTSANKSNEPIAYEDEDARRRLSGLADAFLIGERPIARRVDDSVARAGVFGPVILRRSRGLAPGAVAVLPSNAPILALGADLKNTITLAVRGQAFVSQHIGDLADYDSFQAFRQTIADLMRMYEVDPAELTVVHDAHPEFVSTTHALQMPAVQRLAVQHHRAHLASVIAERGAWQARIVGVSFDGTGFGDDGAIWGGEFLTGSLAEGLVRRIHLRPAVLPGGDAAAKYPVQCAAGLLAALPNMPDFTRPPFRFSERYGQALQLIEKNVRTAATTSVGRLFDAAAALLGFIEPVTFEGQAAMWLESTARRAASSQAYPFPLAGDQLDYAPLLDAIVRQRLRGRDPAEIARAFHASVAQGMAEAITYLCEAEGTRTVVLSGGVFQNELLLADLQALLARQSLEIWTNAAVPPNDGGISLGQAAFGALLAGQGTAASQPS